MKRTMNRARVAVGSAAVAVVAVVAVAGFASAGTLSAAPESAPPSTTPGSEALDTAAGSAPPLLDPEREELVDAIVVSAGDSGFPLDRECIATLVAEIPDEDLVIVMEDIASASETAVATAVTMPEYTIGSEPADTVSVETMVTEIETTETITVESGPAVSPETEEIGRRMVACAHGDADPALVEDALAVIQAAPDAPSFDMACVASVLTTFSDETLTLIIEDDGAAPTETAASVEASVETVEPATPSSEPVTDPAPTEPVSTEVTGLVEDPLSSIPDETFTEALSLLICAPELLGEFDTMGTDVATASAPEPVMETGPADTTAADEPTETTTG